MKIHFEDILAVDGVHGAFLISDKGHCISSNFRPVNELYIHATGMLDFYQHIITSIDWPVFVDSLGDIQEVELVFEKGKCYIKKKNKLYLIVVLEKYAPMGMVRLLCEQFFLRMMQAGHL